VNSGVKFEIVIIDDNSPDKTQEVIFEMQKLYGDDKVKLLSRPKKLGLGSAYIDGSKLCKGNFIIIMDADFSHHVKFTILNFLKNFSLAEIFG
jgi:dolichol-phosphate mannosyltransferase